MTGSAITVTMSIVAISILLLASSQSQIRYVTKSTPLKATATAFQIFHAIAFVSAQSSNLGPLVYQGCFTSPADMQALGSSDNQSPEYCQQKCVNLNKPMMGTSQGSDCWCGDLLPASSSRFSDAGCSSKCNGYEIATCESVQNHGVPCNTDIGSGGGPSCWSIQLTGLLSDNVATDSGTDKAPAAIVVSSTVFRESSIPSAAISSSKTQLPSTIAQETIITAPTTPSSNGLPLKSAVVIIAVLEPIVAMGVISLCAFQFRTYRARRLVETATATKYDEMNSEDTHLYLQQKAELDTLDHQRYEIEVGETRYETRGTPIFELPTQDAMLGRQELRGVEHSQKLMAAH